VGRRGGTARSGDRARGHPRTASHPCGVVAGRLWDGRIGGWGLPSPVDAPRGGTWDTEESIRSAGRSGRPGGRGCSTTGTTCSTSCGCRTPGPRRWPTPGPSSSSASIGCTTVSGRPPRPSSMAGGLRSPASARYRPLRTTPGSCGATGYARSHSPCSCATVRSACGRCTHSCTCTATPSRAPTPRSTSPTPCATRSSGGAPGGSNGPSTPPSRRRGARPGPMVSRCCHRSTLIWAPARPPGVTHRLARRQLAVASSTIPTRLGVSMGTMGAGGLAGLVA
jgi:hypothetical protein